MINLINLTPHTVIITTDEHRSITIHPSGTVARVGMVPTDAGFMRTAHGTLQVKRVAYGVVEGLPDPLDGVTYIVSAMVAQAVPHRYDVVYPYDLIRDDQGRVVGSRSLAMYKEG